MVNVNLIRMRGALLENIMMENNVSEGQFRREAYVSYLIILAHQDKNVWPANVAQI
jgi:hypothetical protein